MLISHFGIVLCDLLYDLSPESGGIQYICLIDTRHLLTTLHRDIKSTNRNAADLILIICKCIDRGHHTIAFFCHTIPEIQASGQLTHDHHIESVPDDVITQRTCLLEFRIQICRAQIRK